MSEKSLDMWSLKYFDPIRKQKLKVCQNNEDIILKQVNLIAYCESWTYYISLRNVCDKIYHRSHYKVSGIIAFLGMHRFKHQVSYKWSSGKWGDGRRNWSMTWCLYQFLKGRSKFISYLGNWTSSLCAHDLFKYKG